MKKTRLMTAIAGAVVVLSLASYGAYADPGNGWDHGDRNGPRRDHPAPAPLLAAGIPAFALLGGGVAVRSLLRRFRRS